MLYWYSNFAGKGDQFSSSSFTIEQLKSSGNLRIMKTNVAQKITAYDNLIKLLAAQLILCASKRNTIWKMSEYQNKAYSTKLKGHYSILINDAGNAIYL